MSGARGTGTNKPLRALVSRASAALLRIDSLLLSARRRLNRPVFWVLGTAVVLVLVIWLVPSLLTRAPTVRGSDRYSAMSDVRTALLSVIGAAGVVWGLVNTARSFRLNQVAHLTGLFQNASKQIGDSEEAIRLVGVHAMAQLADEWPEQRQTCVDVLCAYLRVSLEAERFRETRRTVVAMISERLRPGAAHSWQGCRFDLTGARLDVGDFSGVSFAEGIFIFEQVRFLGDVRFEEARFIGADVIFKNAEFGESCRVSFEKAEFHGGRVSFEGAQFKGGEARFNHAVFYPGCEVIYHKARLGEGGSVFFRNAHFKSPHVGFVEARFGFGDGDVRFDEAEFAGPVTFERAEFGGDVHFDEATLYQVELSFRNAQLVAGNLIFDKARFVDTIFGLEGANSSGGCINIAQAHGTPRILGVKFGPPLFYVSSRDDDLLVPDEGGRSAQD